MWYSFSGYLKQFPPADRSNPFCSISLRPLALFLRSPSFVFNSLQPLFPKYRGYGIQDGSAGHRGGIPRSSRPLRQLRALCVSLPRLPRASRGASRGALSFSPIFSRRGHSARFSRQPPTAPISTFRINTCKSVSKHTTLSSFRINTCEKPRGGGAHQN
jgi:hypothetical protein